MRTTVRGEARVAAPAAVVWDYVTDWPRQGEWIPLTRVELLPRMPGDNGRGVGGRFRAWTGLGPVGFWDPITVTSWDEGPDGSASAVIRHDGRVVRGDAELLVVPDGTGCRVTLVEHIEVPVVGRFLGPLLSRGADLVLRRMAVRAERLTRERADD